MSDPYEYNSICRPCPPCQSSRLKQSTPKNRNIKLFKAAFIVLLIFVIMITIGIVGYRYFFGMSPKEAIMKSSISASDLGLRDQARTADQKIFIAAYSLICSVFFISLASAIVAYVFTLYFEGWIS